MEFTYTPHGVCSRQILLELDGNKVSNVRFIGGCSGNTQGVARLAEGMDVDELISRLQGIRWARSPRPARTSSPRRCWPPRSSRTDNRKYHAAVSFIRYRSRLMPQQDPTAQSS